MPKLKHFFSKLKYASQGWNVPLMAILVLHTAPFGLNLSEYANYDFFILVNLVIQLIMSIIIFSAKQSNKVTKLLSFVIMVVSILFLLDFLTETIVDIMQNTSVDGLDIWAIKSN